MNPHTCMYICVWGHKWILKSLEMCWFVWCFVCQIASLFLNYKVDLSIHYWFLMFVNESLIFCTVIFLLFFFRRGKCLVTLYNEAEVLPKYLEKEVCSISFILLMFEVIMCSIILIICSILLAGLVSLLSCLRSSTKDFSCWQRRNGNRHCLSSSSTQNSS